VVQPALSLLNIDCIGNGFWDILVDRSGIRPVWFGEFSRWEQLDLDANRLLLNVFIHLTGFSNRHYQVVCFGTSR